MRTHDCTRKWNHTCKENGNAVTTRGRCGSYVEREQRRNPVGVVCRGQEELMGQRRGEGFRTLMVSGSRYGGNM